MAVAAVLFTVALIVVAVMDSLALMVAYLIALTVFAAVAAAK